MIANILRHRWTIVAALVTSLSLGAIGAAHAYRSVSGCGFYVEFNRCEQTGYYTGMDEFFFNSGGNFTLDTGNPWLFEHGMSHLVSTATGDDENYLWGTTPAYDPDIHDAASLITEFKKNVLLDFSQCDSPKSYNAQTPGILTQVDTPGTCEWKRKRSEGVSFIVDSMLGKNGTDFGTLDAGVAYARANFDTWASFVNAYASGSVPGASLVFDQYPNFGSGAYVNSTVVGYNSDMAFNSSAEGNVLALVFTHPNGKTYIIKYRCGNVTGDAAPFPNFNVQSGIKSGAAPTPPGGGIVQSGPTYSVVPYVYNTANVAPTVTLTVTYPANVTITGYPGGTIDTGTRTITFPNITIPANGIGAAVSKLVQWNVNSNAPNGTTLTFGAYANPATSAGGNTATQFISYVVQNPRYPSVVASNGDVHAGGGVCTASTFSSGTVSGSSGGVSGGQYVVSASAAAGINNFYSNGSAGSTSLNLGKTGNYTEVCRPDLMQAALDYQNTGNGTTIGSNTFDTTGKSGVYFYNGANLSVSGTIDGKLTIVATAGKITITGPLTLSTATQSRASTPSLGVIAAGNIEINASVTHVDAYLFSDSTIDTCVNGNCNTPVLVINGFMMAKNLALSRLGPSNSAGAQIAEQVTLNPQIYLNPPQLFDGSVDQIFLQSQGEKAPLF